MMAEYCLKNITIIAPGHVLKANVPWGSFLDGLLFTWTRHVQTGVQMTDCVDMRICTCLFTDVFSGRLQDRETNAPHLAPSIWPRNINSSVYRIRNYWRVGQFRQWGFLARIRNWFRDFEAVELSSGSGTYLHYILYLHHTVLKGNYILQHTLCVKTSCIKKV